MVWPRSSAIEESSLMRCSAMSPVPPWRQYEPTSAFAVSEYWISVLPQRGHLFSPSSRPELVSMIRSELWPAAASAARATASSPSIGASVLDDAAPPGEAKRPSSGADGAAGAAPGCGARGGCGGRAHGGPCGSCGGGEVIERVLRECGRGSEAERGLLRRLVVLLADQPLLQHLLVLGELRDGVLLRGSGLLLRGLLPLGGGLLLRGALLAGRRPRLDGVDHPAGGAHARPEHRQSRAAAVLARGLHAARRGLVHEGLRAGAGERVGLLHVGQQLAGALVVLDRDDRGLHDREAAVAGPAVALL